jgi:hypothetical protein
MMMEIKIELKRDTDNSDCRGQALAIESDDDSEVVHLKLENPDREITVCKSDLRKVMQVLL